MPGYNVVRTQKALPIGSVQPWGGNISEIPSGWLLCNGAEVEAADYPLLARILRDTYGGTSFDGNFPNYTGTFTLPQTNSKALADISTNYFGTYDSATGLIPSPIDNANALTIVEEFIGDSVAGFEPGDLGPPNVVTAQTDLNFSYTPDPEGTVVSIIATGTAPTVTSSKIYKLVTATNGTNADSGNSVTGTGAKFTVVINTDNTYSVVTKVKGSGYEVADVLTIPGTTFSTDGGASTANDITITIGKVGNSYFDGTIEGQTIIKGFSIKEVYVVPRKLGRKHFPQHFHEGPIETISTSDNSTQPGSGVGVFANPELTMEEYYDRTNPCPYETPILTVLCPIEGYGILQCASPNAGFWFGNSPSQTVGILNSCPFETGVGRYAIGSVGGSTPVREHRPYTTSATGHGIAKTWFTGSGSHFNLRAKDATTSASGDPNMTALKNTGRLFPGYKIPFSDSQTNIVSPNYDDGTNGSDDAHGYTKTLFNHAGVKFTNDTLSGGGIQDVIEAHDHEGSFNVQYDGSNVEINEQIPVLAQPNVIPDSLEGALQITFTTRVATLTITNLIRAY